MGNSSSSENCSNTNINNSNIIDTKSSCEKGNTIYSPSEYSIISSEKSTPKEKSL